MSTREPHRHLTAAQRETLRNQAWSLSLTGTPNAMIAVQLSLNRNTVGALLREQRRRLREQRDDETGRDDLVRFIAEMQAVMAQSWEYADAPGVSNSSRAAHLANFIRASEAKARALGLFEPERLRGDEPTG